MDKKIVTISIIIACSLTFIIGYQGGKTSQEETLIGLEEDNSQLKSDLKKSKQDVFRLQMAREKLSSFTESQLKELRELKGKEEQFQKIDEMMGKMMLILLADLGIKLSTENRSYVKNKTLSSSPEARSFDENEKEKILKEIPEKENFDDFVTGELDFEDEAYFPPNMTGPQVESAKKLLRKRAKRFQGFSDFFKGHVRKKLVSSRHKKLLFTKKYLQNDLKAAPRHLLKLYESKRLGEFRRALKSKSKLYFRMKYLKEDEKGFPLVQLEMRVNSKGSTYISIDEKYQAFHPKDHNDHGKGPCRFLVLRPVNGTAEIFLSYTNPDKVVFGKMLDWGRQDKRPIGYFILNTP